jgi:hypothetical protein
MRPDDLIRDGSNLEVAPSASSASLAARAFSGVISRSSFAFCWARLVSAFFHCSAHFSSKALAAASLGGPSVAVAQLNNDFQRDDQLNALEG